MLLANGAMRRALIVVTAVVVAMVSTTARAALLPPGGQQFPAATVAAPSGGTVIADKTVPVTAPTFSGTVETQVIRGEDSNGGSTSPLLTFVYRITNDSTSPNTIKRATIDSFGNFATDVGYATGSGIAPAIADRGINGDVIGFDFRSFQGNPGNVIGAGQGSDLLVIRTNATTFEPTTLSLIDGSTGTAPSFAPANVIPEPASAALLLCAGAGLLVRRKRSR